jgi:AraC-like DNA-binding protein
MTKYMGMSRMFQPEFDRSETSSNFGSGKGRLRFFRKYEMGGKQTRVYASRKFYDDEGISLIVEEHFRQNRPFLRHRYMLDDMVADIGIPRHVLSSALRRLYGMGFPNLVNRYRILYLLENREKPEWRRFTQEAVGMECGFSSRNSFIKNVKLFLGVYPSEVLREKTSDKVYQPEALMQSGLPMNRRVSVDQTT